jgi:hypothetical protein
VSRRLKIAYICLAAAVLSWLMLPDRVPITRVNLALAFKVALFLLAAVLIAFLLWLAEPFWDMPKLIYRRFFAPYVRLRRMRRKQHDREWQRASARDNDHTI